MIIVLTRVWDDPYDEWLHDDNRLVGYSKTAQKYTDAAVKDNVLDIGVVYVHRNNLLSSRLNFNAFWAAAVAAGDVAVIVHPGNSNTLQDVRAAMQNVGCVIPERIMFVEYHGDQAGEVVKIICTTHDYEIREEYLLEFVKRGGTNASTRAHKIVGLLGGIATHLRVAQDLCCKSKYPCAMKYLQKEFRDGKEAIEKLKAAVAGSSNEELKKQGNEFINAFMELGKDGFDVKKLMAAVSGADDKFMRWTKALQKE